MKAFVLLAIVAFASAATLKSKRQSTYESQVQISPANNIGAGSMMPFGGSPFDGMFGGGGMGMPFGSPFGGMFGGMIPVLSFIPILPSFGMFGMGGFPFGGPAFPGVEYPVTEAPATEFPSFPTEETTLTPEETTTAAPRCLTLEGSIKGAALPEILERLYCQIEALKGELRFLDAKRVELVEAANQNSNGVVMVGKNKDVDALKFVLKSFDSIYESLHGIAAQSDFTWNNYQTLHDYFNVVANRVRQIGAMSYEETSDPTFEIIFKALGEQGRKSYDTVDAVMMLMYDAIAANGSEELGQLFKSTLKEF